MATVLTFTYVSCKKDEFKTPGVADFDAKYETYYRMKSFFERTEGKQPAHPALLPRSGYSANDIIEYVEGTLNLVYSDPGLTWEDLVRARDTFYITLDEGYAEEEDVEDLFDEARDSASVFFHGIEEPDKFPSVYNVVELLNTSSLLKIEVQTWVGKVHRDPTPFGENDYWDIFNDKGLCDPADDLTATTEANGIMTAVLTDYYKPYGCVAYYNQTDVDSQDPMLDPPLTGWGADNPNEEAGDWIMDFRTFYTSCEHGTSECSDFVNNGVYCLAPDEMNYYFGSIVDIFDNWTAETDLVPQTITISLYETTQSGNDIKSWECFCLFSTFYYCAEGNEFPFVLPFCCN